MPLFWLSLSFLIGIVLAKVAIYEMVTWLILSSISFAFLISPKLAGFIKQKRPELYKKFKKWKLIRTLSRTIKRLENTKYVRSDLISIRVLIPLLFCSLFLGAARYSASIPEFSADFVGSYSDSDDQIIITGVIESPPDVRDSYINLRIQTERLRYSNDFQHIDIKGTVLARVPIDAEWHYGDRVILRGYLDTPPENEDFSYQDYLATQGIYAYMPFAEASLIESGQGNVFKQAIFSFKANALDRVYQLFPDPEASLIGGILLGVESGIPQNVRDAFNDTGTAHIIVISGFNFARIPVCVRVQFLSTEN